MSLIRKDCRDIWNAFMCEGAIFTAITKGTIVRYEHKTDPKHVRPVYEYIFNGEMHTIAITISDNGYIVGANPE